METQISSPTSTYFYNIFYQEGSQQQGQLSTISPKEASPAEANNDYTLKSMLER